MAKNSSEYQKGAAGETAPGVTMLRQLWDIPQKPSSDREVSEKVSTDIYSTPNSKSIPSRPKRRS